MDSLTQAALGAPIGEAILGKKIGRNIYTLANIRWGKRNKALTID